MSRNEILKEWNSISCQAAAVLANWVEFYERYTQIDHPLLDDGFSIDINARWALFISRVDDQDDGHDDDHNDRYKNN